MCFFDRFRLVSALLAVTTICILIVNDGCCEAEGSSLRRRLMIVGGNQAEVGDYPYFGTSYFVYCLALLFCFLIVSSYSFLPLFVFRSFFHSFSVLFASIPLHCGIIAYPPPSLVAIGCHCVAHDQTKCPIKHHNISQQNSKRVASHHTTQPRSLTGIAVAFCSPPNGS